MKEKREMRTFGTLLAVRDMERAKRFYMEAFDLEVLSDFGANVVLTGGIALQTAETWRGFIGRDEAEITFRHYASEIGFETEDLDGFLARLEAMGHRDLVHPPIEHGWGQRVVRLYDPDGHIVEVGEDMHMVVRRFLESGLSEEETARRMDVPVEYVRTMVGE